MEQPRYFSLYVGHQGDTSVHILCALIMHEAEGLTDISLVQETISSLTN